MKVGLLEIMNIGCLVKAEVVVRDEVKKNSRVIKVISMVETEAGEQMQISEHVRRGNAAKTLQLGDKVYLGEVFGGWARLTQEDYDSSNKTYYN